MPERSASAFFADRRDAGRRLAQELSAYARRRDAIVLALPRGGVPVGYEVARSLELPLDVFIVRKLGVPGHEELAMGAIASGGVRVINQDILAMVPHPESTLAEATAAAQREVERREIEYRGERAPLELRGKTVILVDDGLATGATMRATVAALRERGTGRIVVAVPVGSPQTCAEFAAEVHEAICLIAPEDFRAVGQFYRNFSQTTDEEVHDLLARASGPHAPPDRP